MTGPAASGKSRLLAALHGDARPDAGDVMIDGVSLYRGAADALPRYRRMAGLVHEMPEAGGRTVRELFRLAALAAGDVPEAERRARETALLSMVGLPDVGEVAFESLSTSEQARAALAVELFRGPRVLLLDAPLARVGKEWMDMLSALFRALAREGRIIVFAERELPQTFPMKSAKESVRSGPFMLTPLAAGAPGEVAG